MATPEVGFKESRSPSPEAEAWLQQVLRIIATETCKNGHYKIHCGFGIDSVHNIWEDISASSRVTPELVRAHPELRWHGCGLSQNPNITIDFVLEREEIYKNASRDERWHGKYWDWRHLSRNPAIKWEDVMAHPDLPWHWVGMAKNPSIMTSALVDYMFANPELCPTWLEAKEYFTGTGYLWEFARPYLSVPAALENYNYLLFDWISICRDSSVSLKMLSWIRKRVDLPDKEVLKNPHEVLLPTEGPMGELETLKHLVKTLDEEGVKNLTHRFYRISMETVLKNPNLSWQFLRDEVIPRFMNKKIGQYAAQKANGHNPLEHFMPVEHFWSSLIFHPSVTEEIVLAHPRLPWKIEELRNSIAYKGDNNARKKVRDAKTLEEAAAICDSRGWDWRQLSDHPGLTLDFVEQHVDKGWDFAKVFHCGVDKKTDYDRVYF